jgi:hypothetical protein
MQNGNASSLDEAFLLVGRKGRSLLPWQFLPFTFMVRKMPFEALPAAFAALQTGQESPVHRGI